MFKEMWIAIISSIIPILTMFVSWFINHETKLENILKDFEKTSIKGKDLKIEKVEIKNIKTSIPMLDIKTFKHNIEIKDLDLFYNNLSELKDKPTFLFKNYYKKYISDLIRKINEGFADIEIKGGYDGKGVNIKTKVKNGNERDIFNVDRTTYIILNYIKGKKYRYQDIFFMEMQKSYKKFYEIIKNKIFIIIY